jgi:crossover junction endodeoxyribonuclease RusA
MIRTIEFWVAGIPKGQPRPKAFVRGGHAAVYDPGTAEGWKGQIALAARELKPESPLVDPISLRLTFSFPRPKSHYRGGKPASGLKANAPARHTGKPDADNAAKAVMDCLTVLGFWKDDAQVSHLTVRKNYGEHSGCLITISEA